MATSANGWPVIAPGSTFPRLHRWRIAGADREVPMRDGSAGFLLADHLAWMHDKIHPIDGGILDDWGYAFRPVRGQSSGYSNHASGTACDYNAVAHPLGAVNTFVGSIKYRAKMMTRMAAIRIRVTVRYRGCVRWGGTYSGRKDEMHFEINRSLSACEARARKLMITKRGRRTIEANPSQSAVILS